MIATNGVIIIISVLLHYLSGDFENKMRFLRYSEVSNLRVCDIVIHYFYMTIFVEKSKTGIYRNRNWLYLAKILTLPSTLLRRYTKLAQIDKHSNGYILRGLYESGKSFRQGKKTYILVTLKMYVIMR